MGKPLNTKEHPKQVRRLSDLKAMSGGDKITRESSPGLGRPGSASQALGHGKDVEGSSPDSSRSSVWSEGISRK